ncbi:helix-turn-helix domain-containing protein [Erythrobacter sp. sf7]|uniref:Helix-turn-helix domain-containing protein n=1 Tax=Erythrobacter fulvus TaxID=2987523 RepID=A0ABT5JLN7_9SPHN|nr:helix-turn-helix domain-containing protein [Erythrobacter fulvus]MDC8753667.1 helix-turn-helix domain-containing protein [Erythrobacter fulvus]
MQFKLELVPPPLGLAGRINTFYVIETHEARIEEVLPAYSAQLTVMIRGRLVIDRPGDPPLEAGSVAINAPQLRASSCVLEGPAMVVGASFTQIGWQELAHLPADAVHDRLLLPGTIFSPEQCAALETAATQCAGGELPAAALCAQIGEMLATPRFDLRPDHVATVEAIMRWLGSGLDPVLDDLYAMVDLSPRQLQRLSRRYFGVPPAQVLKRFRAIRAAMVLANPTLPDSLRDRMLASFFDQAHLIRDIRRYTGRTPTQLRAKTLSAGLLDPSGHGDTAGPIRDQIG